MKKPQTVSPGALARELNISRQTVWKKLRRGQTVQSIKTEAEQWHQQREERAHPGRRAGTSQQAAARTGDGHHQDPGAGVDLPSFAESRARKEFWLASLREQEAQTRRGQLMPRAEVRLWGVRFLSKAVEILRGIGPSLQDSLANESDPIRCGRMIGDEIERALATLHGLEDLWHPPASGAEGETGTGGEVRP